MAMTTQTNFTSSITLRQVALRDGRQGVQAHLQTAVKCDWILLASAADVHEFEVGAFAPPVLREALRRAHEGVEAVCNH
jgi:isopropylmalate/homocitrate/citramalate synthase